MEPISFPEPASEEALKAFHNASQEIIKKVVSESLANKEDVAHHGDEAERIITSGLQFTTSILESAMRVGEASLLKDQIEWAGDRLPHDGVSMAHVARRMNILIEVVKEVLPSRYADEIIPYIQWMLHIMPPVQK